MGGGVGVVLIVAMAFFLVAAPAGGQAPSGQQKPRVAAKEPPAQKKPDVSGSAR